VDFSVGAIGAAAIGAVISLLTLVISKETKTSEFRQAWIDALRTDVADAISSVALLLPLLSDIGGLADSPPLEPFARTSALLARIELRLNNLEEDHAALRDIIRETEKMIRDAQQGEYDPEAAEGLSSRAIAQTQIVLKREWDRVRKGETTFQITKACAIFCAVAVLITAVVMAGR